jgi:hypothetical protein
LGTVVKSNWLTSVAAVCFATHDFVWQLVLQASGTTDFEDNFEIIRLLQSRASNSPKKEYADSLIEAPLNCSRLLTGF